jgi:hypothetical protein
LVFLPPNDQRAWDQLIFFSDLCKIWHEKKQACSKRQPEESRQVNILDLLLWNNCVFDLGKATTRKSLNIPIVPVFLILSQWS